MKRIIGVTMVFCALSATASAQSTAEEIRKLRQSLEFESDLRRYDMESERIRQEAERLKQENRLGEQNQCAASWQAGWTAGLNFATSAQALSSQELRETWGVLLNLALATSDGIRTNRRLKPLTGKARAAFMHDVLCSVKSYALRHATQGDRVNDNGRSYEVPACSDLQPGG